MNQYGPSPNELQRHQAQPYEQQFSQEEWEQWRHWQNQRNQGVQHEEGQQPKADEMHRPDGTHENTTDELRTRAFNMAYEKACEAYQETFAQYYRQYVAELQSGNEPGVSSAPSAAEAPPSAGMSTPSVPLPPKPSATMGWWSHDIYMELSPDQTIKAWVWNDETWTWADEQLDQVKWEFHEEEAEHWWDSTMRHRLSYLMRVHEQPALRRAVHKSVLLCMGRSALWLLSGHRSRSWPGKMGLFSKV